MNVLITGGAGFIGSHIAEHFSEKADMVYVFDNLSRDRLLNNKRSDSTWSNWNYLDQFKNVILFNKDVRNENLLNQFFNDHEVDLVVHAAGQTAVTTSITNPKEDFENNVIGTFRMLETIRKSSSTPRIVFTSTNKVYGSNPSIYEIIESENRFDFEHVKGITEKLYIDQAKHTPYGCSKACADLYAQEYAQTYGFTTAILRMSCIYGTRQFGVEDQGWVAHFIFKALSEDPSLTIFGNGKQVRDVLYVKDLVDLIDKFNTSPNVEGSNVFNVGGGPNNTLSLLELIEYLEEMLDVKMNVKFEPWRPSDQRVYISDIDNVSKTLKWKPKISSKEGVCEVVRWAQEYLRSISH